MENNPSLDELLNYGDDYQYPDLILSDYFRVDNTRKDKQSSTPPSQDQSSSEQTSSDKSQEQDSNEQATEENQEQSSSEQTSSDKSQEQDSDEQATEEDQEQSSSSEKSSGDKSQNQDSDELSTEEENQEQSSSEKTSVDKPQEQDSNEQATEEDQEQSPSEKSSNDKSQEQATEEDQEQDSDEQTTDEKFQEQDSDEQATEEDQEQSSSEQTSSEKSQEQYSDQQATEEYQEQDSNEQDEKNNFDDLLDNYEESERRDSTNEHQDNFSASEKINDITTTKIYKVLKRLVSLSYERFQKGTYKYNKKEILKHYLTNQKFRIMDDLVSPTFKPDVYVFDLSPSNNDSLEMYVNAIGSIAVKDSIIYLTYNECILRKLLIKKESSHGIDVGKVVNSSNKTYSNFDCTIFSEYRSLYEELHEIKDRKIYIFSDFDISRDISRLSQENPNIVWFSTEKDGGNQGFFFREYPSTYIGYYVETTGIEDIEKFINEKNKTKYKRRFM